MNTNRHESEDSLLHGDLVFRIVGCAFEVIKDIGHGLHQKPYENAMVLAFQGAGITVKQQCVFPVRFKGRPVGEYIPDIIAGDSVVVDTKVIERITDHERGQMPNYLKITGHRAGLIINFKRAKIEWERVVL